MNTTIHGTRRTRMTGRKRLVTGGPLFPARQVHVADGAFLLGGVTDDKGMHRAEVLQVAAGRFLLPVKRPRPLLVVVVQGVPTRDQRADRGEDRNKAKPRLGHLRDLP